MASGSASVTVLAPSSTDTVRQPTWGSAAAISSSVGRVPSSKFQSVETAPMVMSKRPFEAEQNVRACLTMSTVAESTVVGAPPAALMRAMSESSL